jgi:hypothetical protein
MKENLLLSAFALDFAAKPRPDVLYHYTSAEALLSIVSSGRIRATHIDYLNDSSEVEWMWRAVNSQLEHMKLSEDRQRSEYAAQILEKIAERRRLNEFVSSFSENGDDLSQWRAYCPSGLGYSIGFDSAALSTQWVSDPNGGNPAFVGGSLRKIRYLGDEEASALAEELDDAMKFSPSIKEGFNGPVSKEDVFVAIIGNVAPSIKHPAFMGESEWRLILTKPHKEMPFQRFRPGKSAIVPYVEAILNRDLEFNMPAGYMISRVIIGPTPNPELSIRALESLFKSVGQFGVQIEPSGVPYRNW